MYATSWDDGYFLDPYHETVSGLESNVNNKEMGLCTDTTERRVLGKLVGKKCYVEWKGREYSNSEFFLLREGQGYFKRLIPHNKSDIMKKGITPCLYDEGNPVYHCRIQSQADRIDLLGKYIPSRNGCYYGIWGTHFRSVNDPTVILSVFVAR
ncbi:DM9 repeat-containing protein [Pseudoalteromonas sp. Of7M-16]|uniref:DM9 repeat-containing protein n=1 Tax=Pseudoalteromonas sp. Of7M-16 TaxID=2917756 RepID=UPI001EF45164|nr:DUF3421 domain-containing protein [Pseudoalteromonas sp. Of7M-16]